MREPALIRFSVFEVDLRARELRKNGVRLKLQEQPFQVLQALVEHPGELVTREELQGRIWGGNTTVDFDQSLNRAVNKLRDSLGDGASTPRFIETLPRRGYRFIGSIEPAITIKDTPPVQSGARHKMAWAMVAALAVVGAGLWLINNRRIPPSPRVVQVTAFTGTEAHVAFSPDGKQVAFAWNGEKQDNTDIYAKVIGEPDTLRLTSDTAFDGYPAWSPDGRQIAFASDRGQGGVYVISALGGHERKAADIVTDSRPAWSPDGKFLLVARKYRDWGPESGDGALFLVPLDNSSAPRAVLNPPPGSWYKDPAYAPGGRTLAFALCTGSTNGANCSIEAVALTSDGLPSGEPRHIANGVLKILGLTWTADAATLIYSSQKGNDLALWRVGLRNRQAERLEIAGVGASYPAIDLRSGRLAFSRRIADDDIWRMDRGGQPVPFLTSSRIDTSPQFSPDGNYVALASGREGEGTEIWLANADSTQPRQITRMGKFSGTPRWSPDGRWIAFDSRATNWNIWIVEAAGGSLRQLTHSPSDSVIPSWSRDGKFIYFGSNHSGRFQIWRMPVAGGPAVQMTHGGGYVAFESADAKTLYYTVSDSGVEGLYAKELPDKPEKQILRDGVARRGFVVVADGIYYISMRPDRRWPDGTWIAPFLTPAVPCEIRFFRFSNRRSEIVGKIIDPIHLGLTVSPDRQTFLFTKITDSGADLMMIENFR